MKDDTTSEPDNEKEMKREPIPKCVRNALWINYFKNLREGKCQCCLRETISIGNFHAGHIKAHANGGSSSLDNLVPICMLCNCSMTNMILKSFLVSIKLYFLELTRSRLPCLRKALTRL